MSHFTKLLEGGDKDLVQRLARYHAETRALDASTLRKLEFIPVGALVAAAQKNPGIVPLKTEELEKAAIKRALKELARKGYSEGDIKLVEELLAGGGVVNNLGQVSAAVVKAARRLPKSVCQGFKLAAMETVAKKIRDDLEAIVAGGANLAARLMESHALRIDAASMNQLDPLFRDLLEIGPIDVIRDWAVEMLGVPAVRAAIMIYARRYNLDISEKEIDSARKALESGSLVPILAAAMDRFETDRLSKVPMGSSGGFFCCNGSGRAHSMGSARGPRRFICVRNGSHGWPVSSSCNPDLARRGAGGAGGFFVRGRRG